MPKIEKRWYVVGRGFNGWHATGINASSSGGNLDGYDWHGKKIPGYAAEAFDGALVYDAQHLEGTDAAGDFVRHVIGGPMVNPELAPDEVRAFSTAGRRAALMMLPGLSGAFRRMALAAQDEKFGGLDYVGVGIFEGLLRRIPGIKIGHVRNGKVEWEGAAESK